MSEEKLKSKLDVVNPTMPTIKLIVSSFVFNLAILKLHFLQSNCFCFRCLAPYVQLPKEICAYTGLGNVVSSCV